MEVGGSEQVEVAEMMEVGGSEQAVAEAATGAALVAVVERRAVHLARAAKAAKLAMGQLGAARLAKAVARAAAGEAVRMATRVAVEPMAAEGMVGLGATLAAC
jgi:hypothetical protein